MFNRRTILESDRFWVCIIETNADKDGNRYGLLASDDKGKWMIHGFQSERDGLDYFEIPYNKAHRRSYEASMSACVNAIFFRPSILSLTMEEINSMIGKRGVERWGNISGSVNVIPLSLKKARAFHKNGNVPKLIEDAVVA